MDAKQYIKRYFKERGLTYPKEALDAFLFLTSEVGETADAFVHVNDAWVRNNPDKARNLDMELADIYMMLFITADLSGVDLDEALFTKMRSKGYDYVNRPSISPTSAYGEERKKKEQEDS